MLAYACSPYRGSEPGTGWRRACENAKYFDTWVICEQNEFEAEIRQHEEENGRVPGLFFCFVPKTPIETAVSRIPGLYYLTYKLWHLRAYRAAEKLQEEFSFDLVHQANMCGFREPGYLRKMEPPFVWGPVGGSQNYPWRFLASAGWAGSFRECTRSIINRTQLHFSPSVRKAANRAAVILAANSQNQRDFERVHGVTPELFLEIGTESIKPERKRKAGEGRLRLLWSGELKHHKALHLLLGALAGIPVSTQYELRILGDGPLEGRWKLLARKVGVEPHCHWLGWLPLEEALLQYDWADVFVFTSLRDTAGTVILEALSRGVPVVCLDHQGAGDIVTSRCGEKVAVMHPKQVIEDLARVLIELAHDSGKLETLSQGAPPRAGEFHWARQGERLAEIYRRVMDGDSRRDGSQLEVEADGGASIRPRSETDEGC